MSNHQPMGSTMPGGAAFPSASAFLGQLELTLEHAPCAAYLVKMDPDFTLLCGNNKLYELLELSPERLRIKYGNRLGALLDSESLKVLPSLASRQGTADEFLHLELHMHHHFGHEKWFRTCVACVDYKGETVYCCFSHDITDDVLCRRSLVASESFAQFVTSRIQYELFLYDSATGSARVLTSLSSLRRLFPDASADYPHFTDTMIQQGVITPESCALFLDMFENLRQRDERTVCEIRLKTGEGDDTTWALFSLEFITLHGVENRYAVGILEDITQQKEAMANFLRETQFFQALLSETMAYGQMDITDDRPIQCGGLWTAYNDILDKTTGTELMANFFSGMIHPEDRRRYQELVQRENLLTALQSGADKLSCELRCAPEPNRTVWMCVVIHLFRDSLSSHVMALIYLKNIDLEKRRQLALLRDPEHDRLTNIYSKRMAEFAVQTYLQGMRTDELCAMIICDIDTFRVINDSFSHNVGDDVLVGLAGLLSQTFRKNDIIGRFGGDEFMVFIKNMASLELIQARLDELYQQISLQPEPSFTISAGVALAGAGITYTQLFQHADSALLAAKNAGKNRYLVYDQLMAAPGAHCKTPEETPSASLLPQQGGASSPLASPFDAYIASNGDIAYLVDVDTFDLICGNAAFYRQVGSTPEQCHGVKCYEIMQGRKTPCPFCGRINWSTERFYLWRNMNQHLGKEFLIKNKLIQWEGRETLIAIVVDISSKGNVLGDLGGTTLEGQAILSGIQAMSAAPDLPSAMVGALENIGLFYKADSAQLWARPAPDAPFQCRFAWSRSPQVAELQGPKALMAVDAWLHSRNWINSIFIENQDIMLRYSYDMYQTMKQLGLQNTLWAPLSDGMQEFGCISVQNSTANLRNGTFLNSFSEFVVGEHKRRDLITDILHAGTHDKLTGLLNRNSYDQFIHLFDGDTLDSVGVVMADFDSLKGINARRGYHTGNDLLAAFARILSGVFPTQSIFRLNGDEFLVVAKNISQADLDDTIQRLRADVKRYGQFGVSVGYCWDNVEKNLPVMVENSTIMMGVNKKRHHDTSKDIDSTVRSGMLQDLVLSLERREYVIFLQPKVDLESHTLIGAEALVRYRDPKRGIIPPGQFIDMMERNNFIRYIDLYVFEEVCRLLQKWKRLGLDFPKVSLNFSRLTLLESDIVASVEAIFSQYDVPKDRIEIEVTESFADTGKGVLSQSVCGLYRAGYSISLDDFGTKYTNLSLLSDFDFDVLKLDKSLIRALVDEGRNQIILQSVLEMCANLGIAVIAEGVETQEQENVLRSLGCRLGQGYLYGKPMEISAFEAQYLPCPALGAGV